MSSGALPPSVSLLTSAAVSAFGWSRQQRSYGSMESNSVGHLGGNHGAQRRRRRSCRFDDDTLKARAVVHPTSATGKPLARQGAYLFCLTQSSTPVAASSNSHPLAQLTAK